MFLKRDILMIKKAFGVAVAIATYVVVAKTTDQIILPHSTIWSQWSYPWALGGLSALSYLFAMAAGSWTAKGRFYLISLLLWAIPWVAMVPWLYKMQQAVSPMGRLEFLIIQLPFVVPSLGATLLGSWLGTWLSSRWD